MLADALVVLGCRIPRRDEATSALARRVARAAEAFLDGAAPRVVASGGVLWDGVREAEWIADQLAGAGVPRDAVELELASRSTFENARLSARILAARGARRVAVVTCAWHLPRAVRDFRATGLEVVGLAAPSPPVPAWRATVRDARERACGLLDACALRLETA